MEKEISSGTMLGIVLIALAAVIGLGFGVFAIAKGVANEGVVNVQDNLGAVSDSAYTDYDNKIVTGTQVKAAYNSFKGKPVAILINTQAIDKGVKHANNHEAYVLSVGSDDVQYINYNAILAADETGVLPTKLGSSPVKVTGGTEDVVGIEENYCTVETGFAIDSNGKVLFDSNVGGFERAGNSEFISNNAKFEAQVIKDGSKTNIGVIFTQLAQ